MEIKLLSKDNTKMSYTSKFILLGLLVLLFLIPLEIIKSTIMERQRTGEESMNNIENQWGKTQTVGAPILNIPFTMLDTDGNELPQKHIAHFLPQDLSIRSIVSPEIRYRSIYKTIVYTSDLKIQGEFNEPDLTRFSPHKILWDEAYITIGVTENRGFKGEVSITINKEKTTPEPGLPDKDIFTSGISIPLSITEPLPLNVDISMKLNGSQELNFLPLGKTTKVHIESTWADPKFIGTYLPTDRTIDKEGFKADWTVTHLNRNYPQMWVDKKFNVNKSSFGVELFLAVDHYQKSYRSAKYGLLFIVLTFLIFVFTEITTDKKIHFFHYLLVATALILFFSLLTALSEQIGFNGSYAIASISTILLITIFAKSITSTVKIAMQVLMVLLLLYSFMFVLLQMKEYAYLAGNIGLFLILAIIMRVVGKIKSPNKEEINNGIKKPIKNK